MSHHPCPPQRWARCADGLDADILTEFGREEFEVVPGAALWDHEYLMGQDPKAKS